MQLSDGKVAVTFDKSFIPQMMDAVLARTRWMLHSEIGLEVVAVEAIRRDVPRLDLHDMTAIAGFGGPVGLLIAFSFQHSLCEALFASFTKGLDIPADETELYVRETLAEIVNTILGLCTGDIRGVDHAVTLSPPVILEDAKSIRRPRDAVFATMRMRTDKGIADVNFVGPRELFDDKLNYLQ